MPHRKDTGASRCQIHKPHAAVHASTNDACDTHTDRQTETDTAALKGKDTTLLVWDSTIAAYETSAAPRASL